MGDRYSRTGSMNDLQKAIRVGQAAVDVTPEDHLDRALYLNNLGVGLSGRYSRTGSLNDIQKAIHVGQAAVDAIPEDQVLRPLYSNAFRSTRIGPDRFQKNFRRLLKIYSRNLKHEANSTFQALIVKFVSSYARQIATIIRDRHERKDPQKLNQMRSLGSQEVKREALDRFYDRSFSHRM